MLQPQIPEEALAFPWDGLHVLVSMRVDTTRHTVRSTS